MIIAFPWTNENVDENHEGQLSEPMPANNTSSSLFPAATTEVVVMNDSLTTINAQNEPDTEYGLPEKRGPLPGMYLPI